MKMGRWALLAAGFILLIPGAGLSQGVITGLIVDAQGLSFTPSATPKIVDEEGRQVYGSAYVTKEWAEKHGMVSYAKNLEEARVNPRVAGNPFLVKALQVSGANNRDLVLSQEDARQIRGLAKYLNFLDHGKVVIIVP